jgi:sugar phosphate isomerase/epimerase
VHADDPAGVVDFDAVVARLDELGYGGSLSIEYFDLPEFGWPLADPRAWALDLAAHVRPLL